MSLPEFNFHMPSQIDEVFQLMREFGSSARVMSGGTELLIKLDGGRLSCEHLIGLKGIGALDGLSFDASTGLTIGANTVLADVAAFAPALEHYACLVASIEGLATVQVRHKASVVGNLCNASPCADTATPLMALGARAVVVGPESSREVPVEALIVGPGENSLGEFEIVHSIIVPPPREHQRSLFLKHSPRSKVDIAAASVCISMLVQDERFEEVDIFLGSVAPRPMRAKQAELVLKGKQPGTELSSRAAAAAREECSPISDLRATEEHRRHMIGILIYRGLEQLTVQT